MARIRLVVTCPRCGREYDPGIRTNEKSFARGTFARNYHTCPSCGHVGAFRKADYRVRGERPSEGD